MVGRMVEVAPVADETDERLSLDAYLETWPHESFGLPEVQSFKASLLDYADLLAREDGVVLGSGFAALFHGLPNSPRVMVTVPPGHRGRGAGTALYSAISDWARERGLGTLEAVLADNDPDSLTFAERRGFVRERHEKGVALDLTAIEPPPVEPPPGVEIVTWADRPELARGLFEISLEASPDVPGYEDEEHEPFEAWLAHEMQGPGDRPEATFVAVAGDEAVGYAKFSLSSTDDARPPRPDRGQARLARSRHRPRAEVGADRLGEGERLRAAEDDERRAQHPDAPAERAARLPAVDRAALPARAARVTETIATERLELVWLSPELVEAILDGRRDELAFAVPDDWPDEHDRRFLAFRLRQMGDEPARGPWLVRAIVLPETRELIGHVGFHGPPGINSLRAADAVEIGYTIFPEHRRNGYATEAVEALLDWGRAQGIHRFVASVGPGNEPSLRIVRRLGFVEVGRHWDDEDGEELEFELAGEPVC